MIGKLTMSSKATTQTAAMSARLWVILAIGFAIAAAIGAVVFMKKEAPSEGTFTINGVTMTGVEYTTKRDAEQRRIRARQCLAIKSEANCIKEGYVNK